MNPLLLPLPLPPLLLPSLLVASGISTRAHGTTAFVCGGRIRLTSRIWPAWTLNTTLWLREGPSRTLMCAPPITCCTMQLPTSPPRSSAASLSASPRAHVSAGVGTGVQGVQRNVDHGTDIVDANASLPDCEAGPGPLGPGAKEGGRTRMLSMSCDDA